MPKAAHLKKPAFASLVVIPGSPKGRGPESMTTGLWNMDSGLAAARPPGMTVWVVDPLRSRP
jgi:hypothetical protein